VRTELLVIGGGLGGYVGAIRAAQLGLEVLLVEKGPRLGGVCLNRGCIPSKALIHAAELFHSVRHSAGLGIRTEPELDFAQLQRWKEGIVERLAEGVARLCKGNGVQVLQGEARLTGPHSAEVVTATADGPVEVEFEKALIATGSRPLALPGIGMEFDGQVVLNSTDVLNLKRKPEELLIVGGGYIGLELGTALAKLGVKVTVVEMMDQLLPGTDPELVRPVARRLRALGVEVHLQAKVTKLDRRGDHAELTVETPDGVRKLEAEKVLVSVGRRPNSEGLGLEAAGVATDEHGFIKVDKDFRTSAENIYAVGDVIGGPLLAHKAAREGLLAAERLAGASEKRPKPKHIPMAIFTDPEIATVGLTEAEARAQFGDDLLVARFPYGALGRALTLGAPDGIFKLIARKSDRKLLGVGIVGAGAAELIGEATLALELGATVEDLARAVHAHPTLSEGYQEAAELALGWPVHLLGSTWKGS